MSKRQKQPAATRSSYYSVNVKAVGGPGGLIDRQMGLATHFGINADQLTDSPQRRERDKVGILLRLQAKG